MQSERTEIVDFSGEKFSLFTVPCGVSLTVILIIISVLTYLSIMYPGFLSAILFTIIIFSIFILYYYSVATKSLGKLRRFSISYENIELTLPYTFPFFVKWSEFEKIEIALIKLEMKPFNAFRFKFIGNNSEKEVTISPLDFHREKINEIIKIVGEYVVLMDKKFSIIKETNVSGVFIRERFK
jgi:hypothetical protein